MMLQILAPGFLYILIFTNLYLEAFANLSSAYTNLTGTNKALGHGRSGRKYIKEHISKNEIHGHKLNRDDITLMNYLVRAEFRIYRADIELALGAFLYNDVHKKLIIAGEDLYAFQDFIEVLIVLNPLNERSREFLEDLSDWLGSAIRIFGYEVADWTECWEDRFGVVFNTHDYVGCHGSKPHMRGFPCALWQLFHFLTVQGSDFGEGWFRPNFKPGYVIEIITDFVEYFYSPICEKCAERFIKLAERKKINVLDHDEEIFWMWELHNDFNRWYGSMGQDPLFSKKAWPTIPICPSCRRRNKKTHWNRDGVLAFLKRVYRQKNQSTLRLNPPGVHINLTQRLRDPSSESLNCLTIRRRTAGRLRKFRKGRLRKFREGKSRKFRKERFGKYKRYKKFN